MTRRGWLALALALPLAASTARAQLVEPPPEADGGDFEVERADSIAAEAVEV